MSTEPKSSEARAAGEPRPEMNDAPPVLGSWRNIYLFVLGTLALLVALFWALTRAYA